MSDPFIQLRDFVRFTFTGTEKHARFSYATLPPHRHEQRDLIQVIDEACAESPGSILLVTNELEAELNRAKLHMLGLSHSAEILSFVQFIDKLELSLSPEPTSPASKWRSRTHDDTHSSYLPRDSIIVLDMDPALPADCALSLIGLVQWAIGIETENSSDTRILVVSTAKHNRLVSDTIHLRDANRELQSADFSQDTQPLVDYISPARGDDAVVEDIYKEIEASPQQRQLIVSFGDPSFNNKLHTRLESLRGNGLRREDIGTQLELNIQILQRVTHAENLTDAKTVLLVVPSNFSALPPRFSGYTQVHVVLEEKLERTRSWHEKCRQMARFDRSLPTQHRWLQVWWAEQAVSSGIYSRRRSLSGFLNGGYSDHHVIEGAHLGGFVASVYDAHRWGINPKNVLDRFIRKHNRVGIMRMRMETQGLFSRYKFALRGSEAKVFRRLLPLVDYDHRLAFFGCIDGSACVRTVKLQILALLINGIEMAVTITDAEIAGQIRTNPTLFNKLVEMCMGFGKCFAHTSPIWLALGLWNRMMYGIKRDDRQYEPRLRAQWDEVFGSRLILDKGDVLNIESQLISLKSGLESLGIAYADLNVDHEGELTEEEQQDIHVHLFRAFMHQLFVHYLNRESREVRTSVTAMVPIQPNHSRYSFAFAMPSGLTGITPGGAGLLRISPNMCVNNGRYVYEDWATIPLLVIAEWLRDNAPDRDLTAVLTEANTGLEMNESEWQEESEMSNAVEE